jgi:hypothetical protein
MGTTVLAAEANDLAAGTNAAGQLFFDQSVAGLYLYNTAGTSFLTITPTTTVFNAPGADCDFNVRGDNDDNMLYCDATTDKVGIGTIPGTKLDVYERITLTGALSDAYAACFKLEPSYSGAYTVTRHNYMWLKQVDLVASAVVTDACAMYFDAAAGTHKAVDAASTKATPGGVDAWVKVNVNGTVMYMPAYTSKTA